MLWGGEPAAGSSRSAIGTLDRLVLRSAPHVLRQGRYILTELLLLMLNK